ncbi:MAG: bifunctional phosphopantothenoylcysteine decarboxylase/phosphopantothenate--cysteine ligase CoaBC [Candidatus Rokubacteria bacterium]|nr:bifunctional phosphopantothenoylcysteine decarboxylase/phosphopantothenate--cysteine ligase CoaBC [Candidatus Rokubacteria bacterium]MBI3824641.1 bifunctional phosphopantothenoylcysteine decarboxylase/phosphopantothenate--cysteine ligase CoaBC [Candidatus Rokubacteria bacterium]
MPLDGRELVLGVTGSIAAYKAVVLLRELTRQGARVTVCLTEHARRFVGDLTFRTLSGRPVLTDLFDPRSDEAVEHVALAERAAAVVVAPATANVLAKAAHGIADDFLTTVLLAARGPVLMAPAMDGGMWEHPAVMANVAVLRQRGVTVMEPEAGPLASGLSGRGRLPEPETIVEALVALLSPRDLAGERVLVTAGPTREAIDPVRYISNRSSGKMGFQLAAAALRRGAAVTLVSGPTALRPPSGAVFVPIETAEEMREAVLQHAAAATIVIKAAAVGDYRVKRPAATKIKGKQDLTLDLTPNPDILAEVAARRSGATFIVGFAAETHDVAAHARGKLESKGVDLLVANDVSRAGIGFDADDNEVLLIDRWGGSRALPKMSKAAVADEILSAVLALRARAVPARR